MRVQLAQDIKLFITTNLDSSGTVNNSGFTNNNTWQLIPTTQGISLDQQKSHNYITGGDLMGAPSTKDTATSASVSAGSLSFSVALNSSKTGPSDLQLWNSLTNQFRYPGTQWQVTNLHRTMTVARNSTNIASLGFLIVYKNVVYKVNNAKVASAQISAPISELANTTWTLSFSSYETLSGVIVTNTTSGYTFTGTFTGTAARQDTSKYIWAPGKLTTIDIYNNDEVEQGSLAALGLDITFNNTLDYLPGVFLDRSSTSPIFASAKAFEVTGNLQCYIRAPGSYIYTLLKQLETTRDSNLANTTRRLKLTIYSSSKTKVCEIYIGPCIVTNSVDVSQTLVAGVDFKAVQDAATEKSFIKFYT
jgi:hypothetical protein